MGSEAELRRAQQELAQALRDEFRPHANTVQGHVRDITRDSTAGPLEAEIDFGGGAVRRENVVGIAGIARGAGVLATYTGSPNQLELESLRVVSLPPGAAGPAPAVISTPAIDRVVTARYIEGGATWVNGFVLLRNITEQMAGQPVAYEVELQEVATGAAPIPTLSKQPRGLARAQLVDELSDEAVSPGAAMTINGWHTFPLMGWPGGEYVATLGTPGTSACEHVWVQGPPSVAGGDFELDLGSAYLATLVDLRGYTGPAFGEGSSAALVWPFGTTLTLTSTELGFNGLLPNVAYRVRARAILNGKSGNWSDWTLFTSVHDTTPPGWTGSPTITIETPFGTSWWLSWPPADDFTGGIDNLSHYEVRYRTGSGSFYTVWSDWLHVGKSTTFTMPGQPGERRCFEVRAKDETGNASSSLPEVCASLPGPFGIGNLYTDVCENGGFEIALGGEWALVDVGVTATLTRTTDNYLLGNYSAHLAIPRAAAAGYAALQQVADGFSTTTSSSWKVKFWIYPADVEADEYLWIDFVYFNSGASAGGGWTSPIIPATNLPAGTWTEVSFDIPTTPTGPANEARLNIYYRVNSTTGDDAQVYYDGVRILYLAP
ncbi:MAG: fibronectin type III domain-containing protein [Ardenticatenales bacterium]|nr:fibronectin type III domain-containing protein [Ardenticatenales bacterium]